MYRPQRLIRTLSFGEKRFAKENARRRLESKPKQRTNNDISSAKRGLLSKNRIISLNRQ